MELYLKSATERGSPQQHCCETRSKRMALSRVRLAELHQTTEYFSSLVNRKYSSSNSEHIKKCIKAKHGQLNSVSLTESSTVLLLLQEE
eukprot:4426128-Amphidinium_carterae.1